MIRVFRSLLTIVVLILAKSFISISVAQQIPGYFINNEGINDNGSKYILNSGSSKSFFYNDHIVYQFIAKDSLKLSSTVNNVQLTFKQHNSNCKPELSEPQSGVINNFHGIDPSKWRTNITTYKYLTYKNLYKDIDLKYYNYKNEIKTDFIIHKGASPDDIKIVYSGVESMDINSVGDLVLISGGCTLIEKIPEAYQIIDGIKIKMNVSYHINNKEIGFKVEKYDRNYDLIIDPQLIYSSFIGGSNNDFQFTGDIERDASGNIYFTGSTNSNNFPITPGVYTTYAPTDVDVIVVKMNPTATQMIFSTVIGGYGTDNGFAIELSIPANDIIVAAIASSDFPTTSGVISPGFNGGQYDAAVFKLSNNGNNLLFSTYLGGTQDDYPFDMVLDNSGNILVSGQTAGNFPTTSGVFQPNYGGGPWDAFIAKINPNATILLKSTYIGGSNLDRGGGLAIDSDQNIYLSGSANNGFPVTAGCFDNSFNGGYIDISIAKLNSDFSTLLYATFLGTSGEDWVRGDLNFDSEGNLVVVGCAGSGLCTTDNALDKTYNGGVSDGIIAKISPSGNSLLYCSYLGSSGEDLITNAKYNSSNELILTGSCDSGFPTTTCAYDQSYNGNTDAFISVLNSSLNDLLYSTYIGGTSTDNGLDIIPFHDSTLLIGETSSSNFPVTTNAYDQTYNGGTDLFVMRHYFSSGTPTANAGPDAVICEGNSYSLSSASGTSPATYQWLTSGTGSFNNSTILNPVYIPSAADIIAGDVILTLTVTTSSCGQVSDQMTLTIRRLAVVFAGNDASMCETSGTYNLSEASAQFYTSLSWTSSGTGTFSNSTILHPVYTPSTADIVAGTVILTISATSQAPCTNAVDQMILTIERKAVVFAGNDASICETSGTYNLSDASAQYYTSLSWTSNGTGSFSNSTILHPVYTPSAADIAAGSVTLTLTANSSAPCGNTTDQLLLSIKRLATVFAGADATICDNPGNYSLTDASANNAVSFAWTSSGTGTFSNSTILHPVYTPSAADIAAGNVILTITANSQAPCTNAVDQMILTIKRKAVVFAGNDASICETSGTYNLSDASAQYYTSLSWTSNGTGSFSNSTILHPVYSPSAADIAAGSVTLTLTANSEASCNNTVDQMNLFIEHFTTVYAGNDDTICVSQSYTLNNSIVQNATSLQWTSSGTGNFNDPAFLHPVYVPSAEDIINGHIILTLTSSSACNTATDLMNLIISKQSVAFAGEDTTICESVSSYLLSGASGHDADSFIWSTSGLGYFNNATIINPAYYPAPEDISTGFVKLTFKAISQNPCADSLDQMTLFFDRFATVYAGNNDTICETARSFSLHNATALHANSIKWISSGTGSFNEPDTLNPIYMISQEDIQNGFVQLILEASSSCNAVTDTLDLVILRQAFADAGPDTSICQGNNFLIINANVQHYSELVWTHTGSGNLESINSLTPNYIPSENETGEIIFTLTANSLSPCQSVTDQFLLTINPKPEIFAGNNDTLCYGTVHINTASAVNYSHIRWSILPEEAGTLTDIYSLIPTFTPAPAFSGKIQFILSANGLLSCSDLVIYDTAEFLILPPLNVNAGPDQVIEPGTSTSFSAIVNNGFGEYIWNWSPAELFENNSVSNPTTVNLSNSTEFIVVLKDKDYGCISDDTINVFISIDLLQPIAVIDWDSTFSFLPAHINILKNDNIPDGLQYEISIDLLPDHGTISINADNSIDYISFGGFSGIDHFIYKISNIRNTALCDTALVMILLYNANPAYIDPTGFISPNGDDLNDLWYIRNINAYPENEVFIFNRWGSLIKKIVNYDNDKAAWRGEDRQNKKVPDGTYYYSIKIGKNVVTGWILVRNTKN